MTPLEGGRELANGRFSFQFTGKLRIFGSIVNLAVFTCEVKIIKASVSLGFCETYWDNTRKTINSEPGS